MILSIAAALAQPTLFEGSPFDGSPLDVDSPLDSSGDGVDWDRAFGIDADLSTQVVGGERDASFGATVALVFPQVGAFCTASMITPTVALTAGHCVNEQGITPALVVQGARVHWGPTAEDPTQVARIVRVIPHPQYGLAGGFPENDVALIQIEPVPYTDTVWFNETELDASALGTTFYDVGFGINENGQNSSGIKRSAPVTLDQLLGDFMVSDANTNLRRANVCSGDSGGPMYGIAPNGRLLQYAVHSWSQPPECRGLAGSTSTANVKGFILTGVETMHGSADMCANREANDDVYCDPECPDDVICAALELGEAKAGKACQTGTGSFWLVGLVLAALGRRSVR